MLERLFKDLGSRFSDENDLSDLTWALAKNSETFLKSLVEFFNFHIDQEVPTEIIREYPLKEGSRPDFAIVNGDVLFIIENKIYDRNYHFDQYAKSSAPEGKKIGGFGIIVNHTIDNDSKRIAQENKFKVVTWNSLCKFIESRLAVKNFDTESENCVRAYLQYVKEVCSIMEIKKICFDTLSSLFQFNRLIKKIINEFQRDGFECKLHKPSRANGESWSGQYFSLNRKGAKTVIYPFFGIYYGEEPPTIYFAFEKDWCRDIYLKYRGKKKENDLYYIEVDDWEVSFCLDEDKFAEFRKASLEKQEVILKDFFNKVLDEIAQHI